MPRAARGARRLNLPAALTAALDVERAEPVSGGDLNQAYRLRLADGRDVFVKTRRGADREEFLVEAENLGWLAEANALPVPELVLVGEDFLALEWIENSGTDPSFARDEEALGRGLAALHAHAVPAFGAGRRMHLGPLVLPNEPLDDWPSFYLERRLRPLADHAGPAVRTVMERIDRLAGPVEPPALLHGDLWHGNVVWDARGAPWLVDPAAYGGHREMDLAMLELFGGRRERVWAAYEEQSPLADGWEERVGLWQLFPLLVHAALFGGSYADSANRLAREMI